MENLIIAVVYSIIAAFSLSSITKSDNTAKNFLRVVIALICLVLVYFFAIKV